MSVGSSVVELPPYLVSLLCLLGGYSLGGDHESVIVTRDVCNRLLCWVGCLYQCDLIRVRYFTLIGGRWPRLCRRYGFRRLKFLLGYPCGTRWVQRGVMEVNRRCREQSWSVRFRPGLLDCPGTSSAIRCEFTFVLALIGCVGACAIRTHRVCFAMARHVAFL